MALSSYCACLCVLCLPANMWLNMQKINFHFLLSAIKLSNIFHWLLCFKSCPKNVACNFIIYLNLANLHGRRTSK
ncbi:hypothetical protein SRHO_G00070680 [Serrasalmus rhombeus]